MHVSDKKCIRDDFGGTDHTGDIAVDGCIILSRVK
jgi:hypothetical protein